MDKSYVVVVSGPGITAKQTVDPDKAARVVSLILSSDTILEEKAPGSTDSPEKSIREYFDESGAKTNSEKIAIIVDYLIRFLGFKSVPVNEIKIYFEKAAEPVPANISRDIKFAVRQGLISESHRELGSYFVTATGEKAITSKFKNAHKVVNYPKRQKQSGRRFFTPVDIRKEIEKISFDDGNDISQYLSLSTKGGKILWLLSRAKKNGLEKINYKEITELSLKIGPEIHSRDIHSSLRPHWREGRVRLFTEEGVKKLSLLPSGERYLEDTFKR